MREERGWLRHLTGPWAGLGLLLLGLALGTWWPSSVGPVQDGVREGISWLRTAAPYIILLSILPALLDLFDQEGGKAPIVVVGLFIASSALAGIYAVVVGGLVFQLPLAGGSTGLGFGEAIGNVFSDVSASPEILGVFWAFGSAFFLHLLILAGRHVPSESLLGRPAAALGYFGRQTRGVFRRIFEIFVDGLGKWLEYALPLLLFSVGTFVPVSITDAADRAAGASGGFAAMPWYLATAALIAVATIAYMFMVAALAIHLSGRSWRKALREYVAPVYSFAWSTVSSTATIPINVEAAGKGLDARESTRGFVIPLGATVNLDGTLIAAVLITPVVAMAIGIELTFGQLAATLVPLFFMTVGAPGIPAGMSFLAPPVIAAVLGLQGAPAEAFIGVWFAFSLGLADQFRTAVNSVNNGFLTLIAERILYGPRREIVVEDVETGERSVIGGESETSDDLAGV